MGNALFVIPMFVLLPKFVSAQNAHLATDQTIVSSVATVALQMRFTAMNVRGSRRIVMGVLIL